MIYIITPIAVAVVCAASTKDLPTYIDSFMTGLITSAVTAFVLWLTL